jgi:dCMP deaminase
MMLRRYVVMMTDHIVKPHWDHRGLQLAKVAAGWSKDPSTKCGAAILRPDKTLAGLGYNGFPSQIPDLPEHYADRTRKLSRVIHAEMNALRDARERVDGYTLCVWPMPPCDRCASHIIAWGIRKIVCPPCPPEQKERWARELEEAEQMYKEAGVNLVYLELKEDLAVSGST